MFFKKNTIVDDDLRCCNLQINYSIVDRFARLKKIKEKSED